MSNEISNRIHILDSHTANQIAAGEVVERPFSVVKELVENAIDANSTKIVITMFDTQLEKIQVSDNGGGMNPEELRMCVLRHATSKINKVTDLDSLATLGFRGEALPSIASVSQMSVLSKQKDADSGYRLQIKDGKATIPEIAAAKIGTSVTVDRLFYNAPARKKFLKTPRTEMGLISDLIAQYIVAYPHIAFKLINGKHTVFNSSGQDNYETAFFEAYGKNLAKQMLPISKGYISPPELNRASRAHYHFFINGRPAKSRELSNAVDEAYFNFLPHQRYPIVFIILELDPQTIDVNVHPSKLEIKFHDFNSIRQELIDEIRHTLGKSEDSAPKMSDRDKIEIVGANYDEPITSANETSEIKQTYHEGNTNIGKDLSQTIHDAVTDHKIEPHHLPINSFAEPTPKYESQEQLFAEQGKVASNERLKYSSLTPLGQFAGTFIICTGEEYLYIIDQHAAAERVLYEQIAQQASTLSGSTQLAVPQVVELSYKESLFLTDAIIDLVNYGFVIEYFGDNSFIIRGVPLWYHGVHPEHLLRLFLDELGEDNLSINRLRKDELFMAACKQAIKANQYLTNADIIKLLHDLDSCENSATCPHGRPLAIKISRNEIYKRFLRGSI